MALLEAQKIKKTFTQGQNVVQVLNGISASFEQGQRYAITGPSGSGKSTFMHILAGLDAPTEGVILFNGTDLNTLSPVGKKELLHQSIGLVFQLPYLINEFSVLENVMLKGLIAGKKGGELYLQAHTLLVDIGLSHKADSNPLSLSGGEQQRIAIARALFNKPAFLLADEPTGNLDVATGKVIVELLLRCQAEWGMGVIVSSHDAYVSERMNTVLHLNHGILK